MVDVQSRADERCIAIGNSITAAPFPSVVIYIGQNVDAFAEAFSDAGDVYQYVPPRHPSPLRRADTHGPHRG
jgi:hypothetical protein